MRVAAEWTVRWSVGEAVLPEDTGFRELASGVVAPLPLWLIAVAALAAVPMQGWWSHVGDGRTPAVVLSQCEVGASDRKGGSGVLSVPSAATVAGGVWSVGRRLRDA